MKINLKYEIYCLIWNLSNGARLAIFRKIDINTYRTGIDQIILLVLFYSSATFLTSFIHSQPHPEFSIQGITNVTTQLGLLLLSTYIISKIISVKFDLITVITLSIWPWYYFLWQFIGRGPNISRWQFYGDHKLIYIIYSAISVTSLRVALIRIVKFNIKSALAIVPTITFIAFIPTNFVYTGEFWHIPYDDNKEMEKYKKINQEDTYYRQFRMISNIGKALLPSERNITDVYFVGYGSYAYEDVFMKEINYAKELFDNKFDTKGRSVALINNYKTVTKVPLATKSNLELVLKRIGQLIDKDKDVVFIYLTSHGSRKHRLSVNLYPLQLNDIGPDDLKKYLDESGIKWRVLLVSACYSGGFVQPLKNEYSVIMTASAPDKTSFGCGSKSNFTYFGNALFKEQLANKYNFIDAFNETLASIQEREKREHKDPSNPQLFVGEAIRQKLDSLSSELQKYSLAQ